MSILEQVIIVVAKQLDKDPSEFSESTDLQEAGFESLDVIEMIFNLEDEFKIDIPFNANEADTTQMRTVGDIARLIENIKADGPAFPRRAASPPIPPDSTPPDSTLPDATPPDSSSAVT